MRNRLKDLFIPHEGNGFRPNILEEFSAGVMLVLILLSFTMANLQALLWISSDWLVTSILPAIIVDLTNDERADEKLVTLTRSETLDRAAQLKAEDMAANEYFAHYSPTGVSPWYWFDEVAYDYLHAGENLAVHFTDSSDVVKAWMNSPSHRANIMNNDYLQIGVGSAKGEYKGRPTIYVVQLFGTPRDIPPVSSVAGASSESQSPVKEEEPQISVEKVAILDTETSSSSTQVAPATIETESLQPYTNDVGESPALAQTDDTEEIVSIYSDIATTSRDGIAVAVINENDNRPSDLISLPLRSTTEPHLWLSTLYVILTGVVLMALLFSLQLEWRKHHPVQVAYAGGLLAVMALLLYIHVSLTGVVTIV